MTIISTCQNNKITFIAPLYSMLLHLSRQVINLPKLIKNESDPLNHSSLLQFALYMFGLPWATDNCSFTLPGLVLGYCLGIIAILR